MQWNFTIGVPTNPSASTAPALTFTDIEEPINFDTIIFNIHRDPKWHGVFFEASTSSMGFHGVAYTLLKTAKESYGVDAIAVFTASAKCDGETDFTEVISGKLDFANYQESCGKDCIIRMAVERDNCNMTFLNRFDQKVDIDTGKAFDKLTNLVNYPGLGFTMELATQEIPISADANVSLDGDGTSIGPFGFDPTETALVRPSYERITDNSITTGNLNDAINLFEDPSKQILITPQVLLEESAGCINTDFSYEIRMKGSLSVDKSGTGSGSPAGMEVKLIVDLWNGTGTHVANRILIDSFTIVGSANDSQVYNFDHTFSGTTAIPEGYGMYAYIEFTGLSLLSVYTFTYNFEPETSFLLENIKACPPTDSEVYLVNETLARITESITDRCLTIKSDYYGRTDSAPYASDADGCGSLRILTPGLKIRQATDKNFFASMKEVMEGLRAIDNIGMGPEDDVIRIEPAEYFYQPIKILDIDLVPDSIHRIDSSRIYANIKGGYAKWEIKSIKGIDEINSAKEYRTSIKSINNELDIRSGLIAAGYIISDLRVTTLSDSGNTDSTYDNDIFIICVDRDAYGYHVEQGVTDNASNFFSPSTVYNWRIRPLYNLMRWFKSIAQGYVNLSNSPSKIFFTSGAGNYVAEGELSIYDTCRLENKVLPENHDLSVADFESTDQSTPIYRPEEIRFNYPLSIHDYNTIKASPYGYFNVQCGQGQFIKAYIKTIEYKPSDGTAQFTLTKSWH